MTRSARLGLAALAAALLLLPAGAAARERPIFELSDPRGDDHGDGTLVYPDNDSYAPGELDLVSFAARPGDGGTWFVLELARPVRAPDRRTVDAIGTTLDSLARHGFYTFNVDVYIDTDRKIGSGNRYTLPGRRVEVAPETAWDRAVVLTPRPHFARSELRRSMMRALRREMKQDEPTLTDAQAEAMLVAIPAEVERHVYFPHQVKVVGRRIEMFVPDEFLGGKASADWGYVVMVTAADLQQSVDLAGRVGLTDEQEERLLIQPLAVGRPREAVGGGREGHTLQPAIFDLLAPAGKTQEDLLRDYDQRQERRAQVPGVVPSAVVATGP
jgi:hypothetical protein